MRRYDVIVLGAGMVGISTALHLLERGRNVLLLDRRGPAEETSYGNAALIQSEAVIPYAFPRRLSTILGVLAGRRSDARLVWKDLVSTAPSLIAYALRSGPGQVAKTARANVPLLARAYPEHRRLMEQAGVTHLLRAGGYLRVFRTPELVAAAAAEEARVSETYGVVSHVLGAKGLAEAEPHLSHTLAGAIHFPEPYRVDDPGDVGVGYARLFEAMGGTFRRGDARTLSREAAGWSVRSDQGEAVAPDVVVALGPWSKEVMKDAGVNVPLFVKRGYHMHYRPAGNAFLNHSIVDEAYGYLIGPNRRGIRLTTGAEFARRDAPESPVQVDKAEAAARTLFPLDTRIEPKPWMGARPCLPDLLPMIGAVPGRPGLWANFGHHHLGFTLGPATGRLTAELVTGEAPFTDPRPYRVDRF